MSSIVKMSGIKKTYDGQRYVLNGIELHIAEGEIAVIMGASGCGKSTLLNIVGLLDNWTEGDYFFRNVRVKRERLNSYYIHRAMDIGFVFQAYHLIDSINVKENILMPFLYTDNNIDKNVIQDLDMVLEKLNISEMKYKKVSVLSGGERQRVAIARAILKKPKLIIADEPTGNLDELNANLIVSAFKDIANSGTAVIIATHNKHLEFDTESNYTLKGGQMHIC